MATRRRSPSQQLRTLRSRIDGIDNRIRALISERARIAQDVAKAKVAAGDRGTFYRPEREADVLRRVLASNEGPLPNEEMARLFREIMSACLALESPLKVAFLGPAGTFTEAAALKHFGHSVETVAFGAINEVFREVESGAAHFGVVPIENSTEGVINHTLDMFMTSPLKICGEVELRIHHHLLGKAGAEKSARRIVSHSQSLAQCRKWLDAHLPGLERVPVSSNAEAARLAAKDKKLLAIAGSSAAEHYKLKIRARNIEDEPDNTTRFLIVGRLEPAPSGDDKTSLLISGRNRAGSLQRLLAPLSKNRINMTRIESRPSRRGLWEYVFFVDIDGHARDARVRRALQALERESNFIKWLGSYPRAVL
jgi:chorismate mutase/prephenate dehydratase